MHPGMIYGSVYNIRVIVQHFCMCELRLRLHRMAEMLLIDGIANVKYRLDAKTIKRGYETNRLAVREIWERLTDLTQAPL